VVLNDCLSNNCLRTVCRRGVITGKNWETIMEEINRLALLPKQLTWDAKPNLVRNVGECAECAGREGKKEINLDVIRGGEPGR